MPTSRFLRNPIRTSALLVVACCLNSPAFAAQDDGALGRAEAAYTAGDYARAQSLYTPLARAGDARAQLRLGLLHYLGRGVKEDDALAFDWIRRSADQGNVDAQFHLAKMLTFRQGVPQTVSDPDLEAAKRYFAAAMQGHAEAQYSLGLMFLVGKGVERSDAEAAKWIRRAAEQGLEPARAFTQIPEPKR